MCSVSTLCNKILLMKVHLMKLTNFLQTIVYLIWDMRKLKNTHTKVLWIFLWIYRANKLRTNGVYRSFLLLPNVHQSMCTTNTDLKPVPTCTSTVERRRPVAGPVNYWQGSSPVGRSQLPNLKLTRQRAFVTRKIWWLSIAVLEWILLNEGLFHFILAHLLVRV